MPWSIKKRGSRYCVVKKGERNPVPGGCHDTRAQAIRHQRALYANEEMTMTDLLIDTTGHGRTLAVGPGDSITITVNGGSADSADGGARLVAWEAILAIEGELTRDNSPTPRILPHDSLTWGSGPIPFFVMNELLGAGHEGQALVGRIDLIERIPKSEFARPGFDLADIAEDANIIFAIGVIRDEGAGALALNLIRDEILRGVSIDLVAAQWGLARAEGLEFVESPDDLALEEIMSGDYVLALRHGEIGGATAAPMQALGAATIALVAAGIAGAAIESPYLRLVETAALVAAAPLIRPRAAFFRPEPDQPTPLTVDGDFVYGHAFLWGTCHTGSQHTCLMPERSPTGYANYHLSPVPTEEGGEVLVGQLTLDTDHAPVGPGISAEDAWQHYSNTGTAVADVRIIDGRLGGWVSGVLRDISEATKLTLKAAKMSGDWRKPGGLGRKDLGAILMVNTPGFPVPHPQAYLVASAAGEEVEALVAAGILMDVAEERAALLTELLEDDFSDMVSITFPTAADLVPAEEMTDEDWIGLGKLVVDVARDTRLIEQRFALAAELVADEWPYLDNLKTYSAAQRREMAKRGTAMSDGSFPIADCADASNARQSIGRAPEGKRAAVKAHIAKREKALGCKTD